MIKNVNILAVFNILYKIRLTDTL